MKMHYSQCIFSGKRKNALIPRTKCTDFKKKRTEKIIEKSKISRYRERKVSWDILLILIDIGK